MGGVRGGKMKKYKEAKGERLCFVSFRVGSHLVTRCPRMSVVVEILNGMIARDSEEVIDCLREN